ncbi:unnamed protein product [Effrenium voratum]|nr:unnamed protein product [Effrenium voratum]
MTQLLQDWAKQFPEKLEGKQAKLKRAVRAALTPLEKTRLVLYWTRNACGVRVLSCKKDSLHFTFNSWPTAGRFKLAVAVRCAELAALGLEEGKDGYENQGQEIKKLKVNGRLAVHFLSTKDGACPEYKNSVDEVLASPADID